LRASERPEPQRARRAERREERAFRPHRAMGIDVVEGVETRAQYAIVGAALHRQCALAGRGHHHALVQDLVLADRDAEATQSGEGQHRGVVLAFVHLPQSRVDVPADLARHDIGSHRPQESGAPRARGPHDSPLGERGQAAPMRRDEHVPGIRTRRHGCNDETIALGRWQVLERVHCDVDLSTEQRLLDSPDEHAVPQLTDRPLTAIAGRVQDPDLGVLADAGRDELRLRERERAAPRADDDGHDSIPKSSRAASAREGFFRSAAVGSCKSPRASACARPATTS